jgi:hypothetical protein
VPWSGGLRLRGAAGDEPVNSGGGPFDLTVASFEPRSVQETRVVLAATVPPETVIDGKAADTGRQRSVPQSARCTGYPAASGPPEMMAKNRSIIGLTCSGTSS